MDKKVIGIIGGMGPLATADLFKKIITNTKVLKDQDHIRVLIDNNTEIPDRTAAILNNGENPIPQLTKSAKLLENMGADFLIMPCNTAHYFYPAVSSSVNIPVLNMLEITCDSLVRKGIKKVGLIATCGTVQSGLYQKVFDRANIEVLLPNEEGQKAVTDLIYSGVKAGNTQFDVADFKRTVEGLMSQGAEVLVLGCTELPVAVEMYNLNYPVCDPTLELALSAIKKAGGTKA